MADLCAETKDSTDEDYLDAFINCIHPLSEFLNELYAQSTHPNMLDHFWKNPYRTARVAGLPWEACIMLAEGDWDRVQYAVSVELMRDPLNQASYDAAGGKGGPIGVKAR